MGSARASPGLLARPSHDDQSSLPLSVVYVLYEHHE